MAKDGIHAGLIVNDVSYRYGAVGPYFRFDHLTAGQGEIVAVVGRSGAGKSTLIHLLAGLLAPQEGELKIFGLPPETAASQQKIALFSQQPALLPWRTVAENVRLPLELAAAKRLRGSEHDRDSRIDSVLDQVRLGSAHAKYPDELSGGMQTRVTLARAICQDPLLYLLDEPFANLDDDTRQHLSAVVQHLGVAEGRSVVLVTHNIVEAVLLASKIYVLGSRDGERAICGTHENKMSYPRSPDSISDHDFQAVVGAVRRTISLTEEPA